LYDWNGKALQEVGLLEANRGLVSAIAFAPDGLKLAVGDVSAPSFIFFVTATSSLKNSRAKKKSPLYVVCRVCTYVADAFYARSFGAQSSGKVVLYDVAKREPITSRWSFHSARVNALSWSADSLHCASGALDTHVYVWSVRKPLRNIAIKNAVPGGVNAVLWLSHAGSEGGSNSGRLAGAGADAAIKVWQVTFHDA
jgi:WD40 repeat protein